MGMLPSEELAVDHTCKGGAPFATGAEGANAMQHCPPHSVSLHKSHVVHFTHAHSLLSVVFVKQGTEIQTHSQ